MQTQTTCQVCGTETGQDTEKIRLIHPGQRGENIPLHQECRALVKECRALVKQRHQEFGDAGQHPVSIDQANEMVLYAVETARGRSK